MEVLCGCGFEVVGGVLALTHCGAALLELGVYDDDDGCEMGRRVGWTRTVAKMSWKNRVCSSCAELAMEDEGSCRLPVDGMPLSRLRASRLASAVSESMLRVKRIQSWPPAWLSSALARWRHLGKAYLCWGALHHR